MKMILIIIRKKVIIFAQGFTPFRTKIGKFLTEIILKECNLIDEIKFVHPKDVQDGIVELSDFA